MCVCIIAINRFLTALKYINIYIILLAHAGEHTKVFGCHDFASSASGVSVRNSSVDSFCMSYRKNDARFVHI